MKLVAATLAAALSLAGAAVAMSSPKAESPTLEQLQAEVDSQVDARLREILPSLRRI
jgi:hypothetical protein